MDCPGPNDQAQRITRLDIAQGKARCCYCSTLQDLLPESTGWGGVVVAAHPLPQVTP